MAGASPFCPSGVLMGDICSLDELFVYNGSGVMPGRTWVIAQTVRLAARWAILIEEGKSEERKQLLFHPIFVEANWRQAHRKNVERQLAGSAAGRGS